MSDSLDITPENALIDALESARAERPDKCLILFLWDDGGRYDTRFFNAGMSSSQCVALLALNQAKFERLMLG
jgi:hypothetical protein